MGSSTHACVSAERTAASITACVRAPSWKLGDARALVADGVDELERLVVAEGDERIADARIARAAGPGPEFARHGERREAGTAELAVLQFVPFAGGEFERRLAAVELHVIEAAPAFVAAAGELRAFEHAGRAAVKLREDRHPVVEIARRALRDRA